MNLKSIIDTHFTEQQLLFVVGMLILLAFSVFLFIRKKTSLSLFFLFLAGLGLRIFAATLDPYLNYWDEQVHALVAKNLMDHPFKPMLIANPVLPYDYSDWTANHVWVHKQPWFLWQMSLFLKLFGVNEFILRLPMAITLALLIPVIYRMGILLVDKKTGWYGAFLYTTSFCFIHLATGWPMLEHNDAAFLFYVTLSIWAFIEFSNSGKHKWIIWIGIFSGIAILNKWLAGLLVFAGWLISILATSGGKTILRDLKPFAVALGVTLIVALPWQVYTLLMFPNESRYSLEYISTTHFFKALGGIQGNEWFHFSMIPDHYGSNFILLFIVPAVCILVKSIRDTGLKYAVPGFIVVTYLFFTLAATKMPMYTTIVCSLIFLSLGGLLNFFTEKIQKRIKPRLNSVLLLMILCYIGYMNLNVIRLDMWHTCQRSEWKLNRQTTIIIKMASQWIPSPDYVVFNSGGFNAIAFMFYNPNTAYGFYPDETTYRDLKKRGIKLATFTDSRIPDYLRKDPVVIKIPLHFQPSPFEKKHPAATSGILKRNFLSSRAKGN